MNFDEEGLHYIIASDQHYEGLKVIDTAHVDEETLEDNILYVTMIDGFMSDFKSEAVAEDLDEHMGKLPEVEEVYWEDKEYFHVTYKAGTNLETLARKIDRLSDLE